MQIKSVCVYCGCGCNLVYVVDKGMIKKVLPDKTDDVSEGKPCIKGLTIHEVVSHGRNIYPMIRKNKKAAFRKVSWDKAYEFIYRHTNDLAPEEVFFAPSGKITNEDNFVIEKFARIAYGTNNVDNCCSRLCHRATVQALINVYGNGAIPYKMNDVYGIDTLMIIGSNPASNHPVLFDKIVKKVRKIISIQTITNIISEHADLSVTIQPGTEVVLLNGVMNLLIKKKAYDAKAKFIEGFNELCEVVGKFDTATVCKFCGLKARRLEELSEAIEKSKHFGAIHGMGITQHVNAIENVHSLLNLLMLKNGKLLSCRGEINVQGAGDMGCAPDILPIDSFAKAGALEKVWKTRVPTEKGKNIMEALLISPVKAAFLSSFNPAQSMPNLDEVHKNLNNMFLVCMDSYKNLTARFADVILPTPILIERVGTITNGERRIRFVRRVIEPAGESKPEWKIVKEFSHRFGCQSHFNYKSEKDIFKEIVSIIPAYKNVRTDSVYAGKDAWADKLIKFFRFMPEEFEGTEDVRSKKYPLILTTFRSAYHFLTGEMTSKSKTLNKTPDGPYCYMNKHDAARLKIKDNAMVKVTSYVSSIKVRVKISDRIPAGIVAMHFHFEKLLVNKLFPTQFDEETFTPNYKMIAVNIERV
jgi:predicted molibdopterin-dependent oxidoreductase YjgC